MKIGVFDSGIGGKSVADAISIALPNDEVIFVNDTEHLPYGSRDPQEILTFVVPIFEQLIENGCEVIVVACNTVSTTLIEQLRKIFELPLIATEPMVKPATLISTTKIITVCATPTTLKSKRYAELKDTYAQGFTIVEPDCSDWSYLIENNKMTRTKIIEDILPSIKLGSDVIVLGCTHYHWIEEEIKEIVGYKAVVLQPEQFLVAQLTRVIDQLTN